MVCRCSNLLSPVECWQARRGGQSGVPAAVSTLAFAPKFLTTWVFLTSSDSPIKAWESAVMVLRDDRGHAGLV